MPTAKPWHGKVRNDRESPGGGGRRPLFEDSGCSAGGDNLTICVAVYAGQELLL